ncbi:F-box protein CPR1-like [Corylus avellana]|uniref:F-box protein CPR1-like n=1 Tax=Corylus avellana TaxID=13451 RepID=UPI00286C614A|nr:F-box protein CPR1-like [Corylus avellana]
MKNNIYQKKKEFAHQKMKMKTLPQELIAQILSLLPVNPLVRFQCVSKLWFALINDSYFIKLHLNRSKERFLILETDYPDDYSMVKFSNEDQFGTAVKIKRPHYNLQSTEIVGSCNGLVCIKSFDNESVERIVIWNPLIRKYKKLPPKPLEKFIARRHSAFGYDQVNNDYKLLRLVKFWPKAWLDRQRDERRIYSLEVYSLREHSWRMVEEEWPIEEPYTISNEACFSNGAFHWVVTSDETNLKKYHVTFDLSTEKFRVQAFPINSSTKEDLELVDLGGWLFAFFPQLCEVWVMKEYGLSSSWTLFYTVEPAFSKYPPFVFSHDGEEILTGEILGPNSRAESFCLYWYDIKRKTQKIVSIENVPDLYAPVVCVGSLILLNDAKPHSPQ